MKKINFKTSLKNKNGQTHENTSTLDNKIEQHFFIIYVPKIFKNDGIGLPMIIKNNNLKVLLGNAKEEYKIQGKCGEYKINCEECDECQEAKKKKKYIGIRL